MVKAPKQVICHQILCKENHTPQGVVFKSPEGVDNPSDAKTRQH